MEPDKRLVGKGTAFYKPPLLLAFQPSFFRGVVVFRESVDSIIFRHFMFFLSKNPGFSGLIALRFFYVAWQNLTPKNSGRWVFGKKWREVMTLLADPIPWDENHHQTTTIFGIICLKLFPSIKQANPRLGGGFKYFFFIPNFGEDFHFWRIVSGWVGSTTNQKMIVCFLD